MVTNAVFTKGVYCNSHLDLVVVLQPALEHLGFQNVGCSIIRCSAIIVVFQDSFQAVLWRSVKLFKNNCHPAFIVALQPALQQLAF